MIIVKTSNGSHFINEKALVEVMHDIENKIINYHGENGKHGVIRNVETLTYCNDLEPCRYKEEGSEVASLRRIYNDESARREWYQRENEKLKNDLRYLACKVEGLCYHEQVDADVRENVRKIALKYREIADEEDFEKMCEFVSQRTEKLNKKLG